jgi:putative transposase
MLGVIPKARRHGLRLLVTPDTIVRWHRDIVCRRWAVRSMRGKTGRPATRRNIRALVLRLARENPDGGYRRSVRKSSICRARGWPGSTSRARSCGLLAVA